MMLCIRALRFEFGLRLIEQRTQLFDVALLQSSAIDEVVLRVLRREGTLHSLRSSRP